MKGLFIQARISSARFPGKMLYPLVNDVSLAEFVYKRCRESKEADTVAIITSEDPSDDSLFDYCQKRKMCIFRGSLDNVLDRYVKAAEFYRSRVICRVCGDSPFVDIELIDRMLRIQRTGQFEYVALKEGTFIAGFDSEIIATEALRFCLRAGLTKEEQEHVTLFLKRNKGKFKTKFIIAGLKPANLDKTRFTIDYPEDLIFCRNIVTSLKDKYSFKSSRILDIAAKTHGTIYSSGVS